jgi:hypothetical protein
LEQEEYFEEIQNYSVNIIIKPKNNIKFGDIVKYVEDVLEDPISVLFLRCENIDLKLYEDGNLKISKTKKKCENGITKILETEKTYLFLIHNFENEDISRFIDHNTFEEKIKNDEDLPMKLRFNKKVDMFNRCGIRRRKYNKSCKQK